MAAATKKQAALAARFNALARQLYQMLKDIEEFEGFNTVLAVDWNTVDFSAVSPLPTYTGPQVSNFIGTIDFIRKLLRNQSMTGSQGDHLSNVIAMADPLY